MSRIWHPFTQHGLGAPIPRVTRTEGAYLHTADGRAVLDAISSWWVITHGHCHPPIQAAIRAASERYDQIIFAGWTHDPAEELARGLREMLPQPLEYAFFSDSGSTCVEVAMKMALGYWRNRGEARDRILVLQHSYHGDTIGAMSVGERGVYNAAYEPLLFDVGVVPFPYQGAEQITLDALEAFCRAKPAAFIVEPLVLGAGGMLMYTPTVLAEMAAICARHGVLFIADEVMTGWGRTGALLACDHAGVVPDILCLAKGITGGALPLAVTLAQAPVYDAHFSSDRSKMFWHSSSYTANPLACAAAVANLALWRDPAVLARIRGIEAMQAANAARLSLHPKLSRVRQRGTILAMEAGEEGAAYLSNLGPPLLAAFAACDLLIRPMGNTIYLMPPYCVTEGELDRCCAAIEDVCADLG